MKHNKLIITGVAIISVTLMTMMGALDASAQIGDALTQVGEADPTGGKEVGTVVVDVINLMLYIIGILSVIMIIFSGIKYATSAGATDKVKSAKDTLIYSVVGLIIAIFAFAIVNFVLKGVGITGSGGGEEDAGMIVSSILFNK